MAEIRPEQGNTVEGVDLILDAWRARATHIVVLVVGFSALPIAVFGLSGRAFTLAWPLRIFSVVLFCLILLAMALPRRHHHLRAGLLLGDLAAFAFLQLAVTQLSGSGRLSLAALPLLALVLVGPRAGWLFAAMSALVYVITAALHYAGWLGGWAIPMTGEPTVAYWLLQGIRLVSSMLMLLVLMTLFNALQRRTLINERQALRDLEFETASRLRLEQEVARVGEAERCKLGAELHDDLCQRLTAALLACTAAVGQAATGARLDELIAQMREMLEAALESAHNVAHGLCPLCMDQGGLAQALAQLCQGVQERDKIPCLFSTAGDLPPLGREAAIHLYRIAGEAVANAVRHAHCRRITVSLAREDDCIVKLRISDDGRGMPQKYDSSSRLGCSIMAYRAALVGGTLQILSEPGRGTTVTCRASLKAGAL